MKVCEGKISSRFGNRIHPVTGEKAFHNGVDIAAPLGTPVFCPIDGIAVLVATGEIGGRQIHVVDGSIEYHFLHLSEQLIKQGVRVHKGMLIGEVGSTGRSTGPHLHFAKKVSGQFINPEPYIEFKL